ncbi:MAG: RnfABCDGE type electron transport complex subunit B [Candidatus Omnitrophica bacterium]|nr:RnfABCDGE type electron transport complex subunit B [Candidatus Omnitrophota bacterium]
MEIAIKGLIALGSVGFLFSVLLAFLSKKFHVREDPLIEKLNEALPGIHCGACGYSGCHAYAEALAAGKADPTMCRAGGAESQKRIAALLKVEVKKLSPQKIVVHCGADTTQKKSSTLYVGPESCAAAHLLGAKIDCKYGCLFFGDCVKICPVGALKISQGKVYVDHKRCIRCGKCVGACPRNLIELVTVSPIQPLYYVACSNREKALYVRGVCSRGCIACGICARIENSPFYIENNISRIKREGDIDIPAASSAKDKCPTHCIDSDDV